MDKTRPSGKTRPLYHFLLDKNKQKYVKNTTYKEVFLNKITNLNLFLINNYNKNKEKMQKNSKNMFF